MNATKSERELIFSVVDAISIRNFNQTNAARNLLKAFLSTLFPSLEIIRTNVSEIIDNGIELKIRIEKRPNICYMDYFQMH